MQAFSQAIDHLVRPDSSAFYGSCKQVIKERGSLLQRGWTVRTELSKDGGYDGDVVLRVEFSDEEAFQTSWSGPDPTRFPARIRAAATALRDEGLTGRYTVKHEDGALSIAPHSAQKMSPSPLVAYHAPASRSDYESAFQTLREELGDRDRAVLRHHYRAPNRITTASELAEDLGYHDYHPANAAYGRLGRKVGETLGVGPFVSSGAEAKWWPVLAHGATGEPFQWILRGEVAGALEAIGLVERQRTSSQFVSAESETEPQNGVAGQATTYREGKKKTISSTQYERDGQARASCIAHYGSRCVICNFDFEETYGPAGAGYIHVHHTVPISEREGEYQVDPVEDLKPVCPNCHAMIHLGDRLRSTDEVRDLIGENSSDVPGS